MNDARYTFQQTSQERKRTGRGAAARKNGSKSKKCSLPSDNLTESQKKKLNGECKKYDLSGPMNWKQFIAMPKDLQSEYIRKIVSYGGGKRDAAEMFGCTVGALSQYLYCYHKGENLFGKMLSSKAHNPDAFMKWLAGGEARNEEKTICAVAVDAEKAEEPEEKAEEKDVGTGFFQIESGSLTFTGDAKTIFEKALMLMDDFSEYSVTISFQKTGKIGLCA